MRSLAAVGVATALLVALPARAVDWPVHIPTPDHDLAVGVAGGVAFSEDGGRGTTGALGELDLSYLHGVFGLHLGLHAHPEGATTRIGGTLEASLWYLILLGTGVGFGRTTGDGGAHVPERATSWTLLLAVPFPVARLDEGRAGSLVLAPFFRVGLRFADSEDIRGHHHGGLMLKWTTFGF